MVYVCTISSLLAFYVFWRFFVGIEVEEIEERKEEVLDMDVYFIHPRMTMNGVIQVLYPAVPYPNLT